MLVMACVVVSMIGPEIPDARINVGIGQINIRRVRISLIFKNLNVLILQVDEDTNRVCVSESFVTSEEDQTDILNQYEDFVLIEPDSVGKSLDKRYVVAKEVVEELAEKLEVTEYRAQELQEADRFFVLGAGCEKYEDFLKKYGENGVMSVGDYYDTEMPVLFCGNCI